MRIPDVVRVVLFTRRLFEPGGAERLADALETEPYPATHWGIEERKLSLYDRNTFLVEMPKASSVRPRIVARRRTPRYSGYATLLFDDVQSLTLEFKAKKEMELPHIFELGSNMATSLEPIFGFVHPIWYKQGQEYNVAGRLAAKEVRKYGLRSVCARTWFGPDIIESIGRKLLDECDLQIREVAWGGLELDLTTSPWLSTIDELNVRRKAAMKKLEPTGVFGDYSKRPYKSGAKWQGFRN